MTELEIIMSYTRRLPIYLLLDCSESMAGEAITELQRGVDSMVRHLSGDPNALETAWLSVVTFSRGAQQLVPLTELLQFKMPRLKVHTGTALGAGLRLLMDCMKRELVKTTATTKGDYRPIVILLTDGQPTDQWETIADQMKGQRNPALANIYAIGCGPDVDTDNLRRLTDIVLLMKEMSPLSWKKVFIWLTASVSTTSMALGTGREGQPLNLPSLPLEALELAPASMGNRDPRPRQVFLHARCSQQNKPYLMRYARRPGGSRYVALGAHPLEDFEKADSDALPPIHSAELEGVPSCPYCGNPVAVSCDCGTIACFSGNERDGYTCPNCRVGGKLSSGGAGFDVRRAHG